MKKMVMNFFIMLNSVIYSEGKGLFLGGSIYVEESIFGSELLNKNNGYYLVFGNDLNVMDS